MKKLQLREKIDERDFLYDASDLVRLFTKSVRDTIGKVLDQYHANTAAIEDKKEKFLTNAHAEGKPHSIANPDPNLYTAIKSITSGKRQMILLK